MKSKLATHQILDHSDLIKYDNSVIFDSSAILTDMSFDLFNIYSLLAHFKYLFYWMFFLSINFL